MLTNRMKKTINIILDFDGYVTLGQIADELSVSTRTLLRELDDVQKWVEEQGGALIKKKGRGIEILGDEEERQRLRDILKVTQSELVFTPADRSVILKAELLSKDEPTKLFALTSRLDVTESTIANDLLLLEPWFDSFCIKIIRRPGLGILMEAEEKAIRKALVALIYENINVVEFMEYFKGKTSVSFQGLTIREQIQKVIYELMAIVYLEETRQLLEHVEREMGYHFADNAFVALVIRIAVTIKREDQWGKPLVPYSDHDKIRHDKIFRVLTKWVSTMPDYPLFTAPVEELLYLSVHIKGAKLRETTEDSKISMIEDFRTIQLVKEFILAVEGETGIYLADNEQLLMGLVKHLRPAIYRIKMDLDIINPLLYEIQSMYPKLYVAIKNCVKVIEEREKIVVPEDEIAYLATHIGAVIQKDRREIVKKFQVVLACMYGIGASQLLVSSIEQNFKNIEISRVISVMDHKMDRIQLGGIDLVITTVPIEDLEVPSIVVNAILKPEDVMNISEFIKNFSPTQSVLANRRRSHIKEKLEALGSYSKIMLKVLENYSYERKIQALSMNDVIDYVSKLLAHNAEEERTLFKAFEAREEKGSTILSKKGMLLLHCRADISLEVCIKILQLKNPIEVKQANGYVPISNIVVMVGPVLLDQKILNVLSEVSRSIITSGFSDIILYGQDEEVEDELNQILDRYYEKQAISL